MRELSLGYSPCPNDTFIFYALVHGKLRPADFMFREMLEDVETLNRMAERSQLDITKVSYHAFGHLRETYCLLRSGGALGKGCGPLVVAREQVAISDLKNRTIAIPGKMTTAYLLLQIFDPVFRDNIVVMPFHHIIDAVRNRQCDAGLIIHESRFTYEQAGLKQVIDLGAWWEEETGLPIPLGAILARRDLGHKIIKTVEGMIRESLTYAFSHRSEPKAYIKKHSQELSDDVIDQHINLYVNNYTLDIGEDGIRAVEELFRQAEKENILSEPDIPLFSQI
jgi:1,4-dihydroxy-6-naphthoate synthase